MKGDKWSHEARKVFNTKVKDDLGYGITVTKASQNGEHVYQLGLTGEKSIYSKDLKSLMDKRNAWVISKVKPLREKGFIASSELVKVLKDKGISAHTTTERGLSQQISTLADTYGIEKIKVGAGTGGGFWYKSPSPEKLEKIYKLRLNPLIRYIENLKAVNSIPPSYRVFLLNGEFFDIIYEDFSLLAKISLAFADDI